MRAMMIEQFGGPEVLTLTDLPVPTAGENQVRVAVHACALNPVDTKVRRNGLGMARNFPLILGYDVSGVVDQVGPGVSNFQIGDDVFGCPTLAGQGSNAEYCLLDSRACARKPRSLDHTTAAGLPLVTLTAWEALHERCGIREGETVLVHAGAGGVGHIGVQLAAMRGCHVITTASQPASLELARSLGAHEVINYQQTDVVDRVRELTAGRMCPVVFDTVGGEVFEQSMDCVAVSGRLAAINYSPTDTIWDKLFRKNASLHFEFMGAKTIHNRNVESQGAILSEAAALVDAGKLRVHIHKVVDLDDLPAAHEEQQAGHVNGKIVVRVV